jgi:hypothetical protein
VPISSSVGRSFTVAGVVAQSYKLAGLVELSQAPTAPQLRYGRDRLESIVDALETMGVQARAVTFETVELQESVVEYPLSDASTRVLGARYVSADDVETSMRVVGRDEWLMLSGQATTAAPRSIYVNEESAPPIEAWVWPTPPTDEDGTLRLMVVRRLADVDDDNAELDLDTHWTNYLVHELAAQLADSASLPGDKVGRLRSEARRLLERSSGHSREARPLRMMVTHRVRTR